MYKVRWWHMLYCDVLLPIMNNRFIGIQWVMVQRDIYCSTIINSSLKISCQHWMLCLSVTAEICYIMTKLDSWNKKNSVRNRQEIKEIVNGGVSINKRLFKKVQINLYADQIIQMCDTAPYSYKNELACINKQCSMDQNSCHLEMQTRLQHVRQKQSTRPIGLVSRTQEMPCRNAVHKRCCFSVSVLKRTWQWKAKSFSRFACYITTL